MRRLLESIRLSTDPINSSDFSGMLSVVNSSFRGTISVGYNYGMQRAWSGSANFLQPAATIAAVQPTINGSRIQGSSANTRGMKITVPAARAASKPAAKPRDNSTRMAKARVSPINVKSTNLRKEALPGAGALETTPGGVSWKEDIYPRVYRALDTGSNYADKGEYVGYLAGCAGGAYMASPTVFLTAVGCAGGAPLGGQLGKVTGGVVGIVVGLFTY